MSLVASSGPPNDRDLKLKLHYTVFRSKNYYHVYLLNFTTKSFHTFISHNSSTPGEYADSTLAPVYNRSINVTSRNFSHFPFHTVGCTTSMIMEPLNGFRFPEAYYRAPDQVQPRFAPLKLVSNEGDAILRMGNCRIELVVRNVIIGGEYILAGYVRSWGDSESEQLAKDKRFINTHRSMVWRIDKN